MDITLTNIYTPSVKCPIFNNITWNETLQVQIEDFQNFWFFTAWQWWWNKCVKILSVYISSKFYISKLEGTENCMTLTKTISLYAINRYFNTSKQGRNNMSLCYTNIFFYEMRKQKKVRFWVVWIYNLFFSSFIRLPKGKLSTIGNKPASYSQCWSIQLLLFYQKPHKDVEPSKVPLAESAQWSLIQKTFWMKCLNAFCHSLPNYYIPKMAVFTEKKIYIILKM